MQSVADMFDHNNEGVIDWEEFLIALKPEWQESPKCEADKIHDEVRRLVMLCTCRQKFRVFQVGEGKYRVRIYFFNIIKIKNSSERRDSIQILLQSVGIYVPTVHI